MNRSATRAGTIRRSDTRKGENPKRPKGYDVVQQAIKQIYPPEAPEGKSEVSSDVDIVFVPGLGAHPEESWKSNKTEFNWMTDNDGIVKDFSRARVLLFMYESAWIGNLKVGTQVMSNIAMTLMHCLKSKRQGCKTRPIVFIGHSMGGLVIAKAITYADSRRDLFPTMFEAISATIFFGTPFNGAKEAAWAAMFARVGEKLGQACNSKLLDYMRPGEDALRDLRHEFMRLVGKLNHKIQVVCFWEQRPTDFATMAHLPSLWGLTSAVTTRSTQMVTRESAVLDGVEDSGLARNHRDLVKFDGPKDLLWNQIIREHLKNTINGAQLTAKNRIATSRDLDLPSLKGTMSALGGLDIEKKRKEVSNRVKPSSPNDWNPWITKASEYSQWFGKTDQSALDGKHMDCLWIRGREGRGKTAASIAALEDIESFAKTSEEKNPGQDRIILAYFLCEPSTDYCTAEDLLKSLLCQLIDQQMALATHAKQFIKKKVKDGSSKSQAQTTVENLLQCLQDMLLDDFVGGRVYFVLTNLHVLPQEADSTAKLMRYLGETFAGINVALDGSEQNQVSTRWLITSRDAHGVGKALGSDGVRLVDLENERYGDQVQMELRRHAKSRVSALEMSKHYSKALSFFASSLIGGRAQNIHWIDITCVQLEDLPEGEGQNRVRRVLENTPQDLSELLSGTWKQIFSDNPQECEQIKEMLRALVLTFEDPSEDGLIVLTGLSGMEDANEELGRLIEMCKPFLVVSDQEGGRVTVGFMNPAVKDHLKQNSDQLLDLSAEATKWQHGVLALRSLTHINEVFDFPEVDHEPGDDENPGNADRVEGTDNGSVRDAGDESSDDENGGVDGDVRSHKSYDTNDDRGDDSGDEDEGDSEDDSDDSEDDSDDSEDDWDEEEEEEEEAWELSDKVSTYAVKHWLHHGSKATAEFAEYLVLEEGFWKPDSVIRKRWLMEYARLTDDFATDGLEDITALHVAAGVGFRQLVVSLLDHGYEGEMQAHDGQGETPLHYAAAFGRPNIVEELLNRGAEINDGMEQSDDTPLHLAASEGHVDVMKKLLFRGGDTNAYSEYSGLVINAAISSGKADTVELLVGAGVSLTPDKEDAKRPLAQAATMADISMLEYLMQQYAQQLPAEEYSKAMISAARAGRVETFKRLLEFDHKLEDFQRALDKATKKARWEVATILLEKRSDLQCDVAFYQAATGADDKDDVLLALWEYTGGTISAEMVDKSLYKATDHEKLSTVRLLLERYGADPNATGKRYGNALTAAAYDGRLDILQLLLDHEADVNSPDGWAIQTAAAGGHEDIVKELISRGADVNAFTENHRCPEGTALQAAVEYGRPEIVELLLQHDVDLGLGGGEDAPPIIAAAVYANVKILDTLIDAGADVNSIGGSDQSTPLINAVKRIPGTDSLRKLLDAGARIDQPRGDGQTALIAAASEDSETVQFLLDNGADVMLSADDGENALIAAAGGWDEDSLKILVRHVSFILSAMKEAADSGNLAVASVIEAGVAASKAAPRIDHDATSEGEGDTDHDEPDAEADMGHVETNPTVDFSQQNIMTPPPEEPNYVPRQASFGPGGGAFSSPPANAYTGFVEANPYGPYEAAAAGQGVSRVAAATPPIRRKPAPGPAISPYNPNRPDQNASSYQAYAPNMAPQAPVIPPKPGDYSMYGQAQAQPQPQQQDVSSYDGNRWAPPSEPAAFGARDLLPSQRMSVGYGGAGGAPATIQPYRDSRVPQPDVGQAAYGNANPQAYPSRGENAGPGWDQRPASDTWSTRFGVRRYLSGSKK